MDPISESAEAELFKRLLAVTRDPEPASRLARSLELLAQVTEATVAHFEIASHSPEVRVAVTFPDAETPISRGVIAHALSTGQPVESACARLDVRFRDLGSVHRNQVEALLCVPISMPDVEGAVYVDRAGTPGGFSPSALDVVQWFAHQFAEVADRLVPSTARSLHEQTRRFQQQRVREALLRSNWNVASAARDLSVTRNFVYSISPEARGRKK